MVMAYNMTSPLPSQNVVVAPASTMSAYTYGPQQAAQYCPKAIPARNGCWNEALPERINHSGACDRRVVFAAMVRLDRDVDQFLVPA